MTAIGRKRTIISLVFVMPERPLSGKADIHKLVAKSRTQSYDLSELRVAILSVEGPKAASFGRWIE